MSHSVALWHVYFEHTAEVFFVALFQSGVQSVHLFVAENGPRQMHHFFLFSVELVEICEFSTRLSCTSCLSSLSILSPFKQTSTRHMLHRSMLTFDFLIPAIPCSDIGPVFTQKATPFISDNVQICEVSRLILCLTHHPSVSVGQSLAGDVT